MNFSELPVVMPCAGESLLGIVAQPAEPTPLGVVMGVGGPQYRVGSHRQFVLLARRLAAAGFAVMRFDYRGMGDSSGERRSFDEAHDDIAMAIDTLQRTCPSVQRVVLWGLCDGASAALLFSGQHPDARLAGLCLLNPWVRSDATLARTHIKHYYTSRLFERDFWKRWWTGQYQWRPSLAGLLQSLLKMRSGALPLQAEPQFPQRMAQAMRHFPGPVLMLLSARDFTAKEFLECARTDPAWRGLLQRPQVQQVEVPEADHTFSRASWRANAEDAVLDWLQRLQTAA